MKRDDLKELEAKLMELVVQRRNLGGFDVNAEAILILSEAMLKFAQHLVDKEKK